MAAIRSHFYSRILHILIKPRAEWSVIQGESNDINILLQVYVIPIVSIVASVAFIFGFARVGFVFGLAHFVSIFATNILSAVIASYILLELPRSFGGQTTIGTAAAIVIYSSVPAWIATLIVSVHPAVAELHWLSLYTYIIYYLGVNALIAVPEEKKVGFAVIASLILLLVNSLVGEAGKRILHAII